MTLRDVSVIALPNVSPFELGVACEGFGADRTEDGLPNYDFALVTPDAAPIRTRTGFTIASEHRLDRCATSDLVVVPAAGQAGNYDPRVLQVLRETVERGARVMSICTGAFVLGEAGVLDGRRCTTHWMDTDELQRRVPAAKVECNALYVEDGPVLTSAGTASGLDLVLHVARQEHGAEVANALARVMIMPPHRDGGQAQFVRNPIRADDAESLAPVLAWTLEHLHEEHDVESLAARAAMSPRTFARRFNAETGVSPYAWLQRQRVVAAQQLLEEGDDPIEIVATKCGFGSAAVLRSHFARAVGTSPQAYRRSFRPTSA